VLTPTGYRCKECVRGQQKVFETAVSTDYIVIAVVVGVMSFLGSLIAFRLSFFIIFLAPLYGGIIAEAARAAVRKRRSRNLFLVAGAAAILGVAPMILYMLVWAPYFMNIIWEVVYMFLMTSTLYYRLSGIKVG
jgi:hypothetical protein